MKNKFSCILDRHTVYLYNKPASYVMFWFGQNPFWPTLYFYSLLSSFSWICTRLSIFFFTKWRTKENTYLDIMCIIPLTRFLCKVNLRLNLKKKCVIFKKEIIRYQFICWTKYLFWDQTKKKSSAVKYQLYSIIDTILIKMTLQTILALVHCSFISHSNFIFTNIYR